MVFGTLKWKNRIDTDEYNGDMVNCSTLEFGYLAHHFLVCYDLEPRLRDRQLLDQPYASRFISRSTNLFIAFILEVCVPTTVPLSIANSDSAISF